MKNWDDAFANMTYVPGSDALPDIWTNDATHYRASAKRVEELEYGDHPRELMDMVWPDESPKGLIVFVHGGYWIKLDKSFWTHFAEGARAQGWAVCLPQYQLAPEVRIADITRQIGRAITKAAGHVQGPIRLAGHSAGGHLVSRMLCDDSPLPPEVLARVTKTVSISGVHDLRPLLQTSMNASLRLDAYEAAQESPALLTPQCGVNVTAWVGGGERPEFIRQTQLLAMIWSGFDVQADCVVDGNHHHFSVLEGLKTADSPISKALCD
jgi:acetyl esterase/lipase